MPHLQTLNLIQASGVALGMGIPSLMSHPLRLPPPYPPPGKGSRPVAHGYAATEAHETTLSRLSDDGSWRCLQDEDRLVFHVPRRCARARAGESQANRLGEARKDVGRRSQEAVATGNHHVAKWDSEMRAQAGPGEH